MTRAQRLNNVTTSIHHDKTTPHNEVITPRHDKNTTRQDCITRHHEETTKHNEATARHNEEATQHNVVTTTHNEETTQNNDKKKTNTVNARISARGAYLIFGGERGALIRRGRLLEGGRLFHFRIFDVKMTLVFLFLVTLTVT